jgi:GGDEF domain-containing protein
LSIGAASLPDDANTAEALIAAADRAMYAAKQASRSQPIPA